jgi:hypothetical protein
MMRLSSLVSIACVGAAILTTAACKQDRAERERMPEGRPGAPTEPGKTTITGANVVNNQAAIDKIVGARCTREATCKNVGAGKKHADPQACTQKIKMEMREDLNTKECPHGIDQKELDECLEAIQKEDCNNPIDKISRLAACRTSDLCLSTSPTNR